MDAQLLRQYCDEFQLGLLDGEELTQLDRLIEAGDAAAVAQLRESAEAMAEMALGLVPAAQPPALVRSHLLNQVAKDARTAGGHTDATPKSGVVPAPQPRAWVAGWAVAAALAVASLYSYMALRGANQEIRRVAGQLASVRADAERSRKVLQVVLSRDAKFIRLSTSTDEPVFRAFWGGATGLVLSGSEVKAPQPGRTYQLWVVPKGGANPVSAGVFMPTPHGEVILFAETNIKPGDAAAVAISDEPTGGSAQPTTKPIFVGALGD